MLITGAGSGLGRALAQVLTAAGAKVAGIDCRPDGLHELAAELPQVVVALADVADASAMRQAVGQLQDRLGPVDVLIANAGIGRENSATNFRPEDFEAQVRVNLIGVANTLAAVLPGMLHRRRGHLVAISSLASYRGFPRMAGYCASKAGVNALMDVMRVELEPLGIHVTTICPGWIRTPMTAHIGIHPSYMMDVAAAAQRIVRTIEQRRAFDAFPGRSARRAGLLRLLPCRLSDWLTRRAVERMTRP